MKYKINCVNAIGTNCITWLPTKRPVGLQQSEILHTFDSSDQQFYSASPRTISLKLDHRLLSCGQKKRFLKWRSSAILNVKNFHIWSSGCQQVSNLLLCTKFFKIGWFFVDTWRFHDCQDSGSTPSWIIGANNGFFKKLDFLQVVNRGYSYVSIAQFLKKKTSFCVRILATG